MLVSHLVALTVAHQASPRRWRSSGRRAGPMVHNMDDRWMYVEGKRAGRPYMAALRVPFDPSRWPDYDHHVTLAIDYRAHWRDGLPKPYELTRLQDLEDRLIDRLEGHGVLVATETGAGTRTIHLLVRGGGPLLEMFGEHERRGKHDGMAVSVAHDPQWSALTHLSAVAQRSVV